jgi:predicted  nucleic acid-binding Zn-ribbon protein
MYYPPVQADENHEFAHSEAYGGEIHISKVEKSGRNDFTCLGCRKPMLAILRKIYGYKPYFRHDVKDVQPGERCTFRDEEHRRKLALSILEEEKKIRVPPLYKLPPVGHPGLAIELAHGTMIQASRVTKYQYFYEDQAGNVKITTVLTPEMGDLMVYADAVFYNEDEEPFLLIQLSKRKKPGLEQMAAMSRLRLNTLQITIPKESPKAIHRSLMNGQNAKWLYHDDERQFDYLSLSDGLTGGIPTVDVDQEQLFAESFDCRKTQINNLIRAVNKCLASEQFRTAEQGVRSAIGRTQLAITRAGERRDELEEQHRRGTEIEYQPEFDGIEERGRLLELAFGRLRDRKADLEARYRNKRKKLEDETATFDAQIRSAEAAFGGTGRTIEELEDDLTGAHDGAVERMRRSFAKGIEFLEGKRRNADYTISREQTDISRIQRCLEGLPREFAALQETAGKDFDKKEEFEDREIARIDADRAGLPERFATAKRRLDEDFKTDYESSGTGSSPGLDRMLSDGPLQTAVEAYRDHQRYRRAKEFLESQAFQTWVSQYQS